ncbi:MAG: transcriptional repressor [Clostridiales bacterium]|nr:transcriptional repressor [Clostridiales bacterium]
MNDYRPPWPDGMKKTKQRLCVYSVLENAPYPLSAMDIFRQIDGSDSSLWLSTVYRILELFVNEGLAIKTTVTGSNTALYELNRSTHRHYAVCLNCRKVIEMINCPMEKFVPKLSDDEFHVLGHKVEMYGYCRDCEKKLSKDR